MKFIKWINELIKSIPHNILWHMLVGTWLGLVGDTIFSQPWMVILFIALFAAGKEIIWDLWLNKGTPQISAGFATFIMGFLAYWTANVHIPII